MIQINQNKKNKLAVNHIRAAIYKNQTHSIRPVQIGEKFTIFEHLKEYDDECEFNYILLSTLENIEDYDEIFKTGGIELAEKHKTYNHAFHKWKKLNK